MEQLGQTKIKMRVMQRPKKREGTQEYFVELQLNTELGRFKASDKAFGVERSLLEALGNIEIQLSRYEEN